MHSRRTFPVALIALLGSRHALAGNFARRLVEAARERTLRRETYDGSYRKIGYPLGDVPDHLGVCTDLVIRAYRRLGIDLQVLVHEDMAHVNVGFFHGAALADPAGLLEGTGKSMRHVKLRPGLALDAPALEALIDAAYLDIVARLKGSHLVRQPGMRGDRAD
jgi:hypothetical protein